MKPPPSLRPAAILLSLVLPLAAASEAEAQQGPKPRPRVKGATHALKLDSSPQQAAVYWDRAGTAAAPRDYGIAGYTPMTIRVPRGNVRVVLELKGFRTVDRELAIKKSQTQTFTLERAAGMGKLDLRAGDGTAAGAEVSIDGVPRGTVPNVYEVMAGKHQVEYRKPGFKTVSEWLDVNEDERRTRDVVLPRDLGGGGALLVTSDAGGDVYLNGEKRDAAPAMMTNLAPGEYIVEVRKEGVAPWRQTVTVAAGAQSKVSATFGPGASMGGTASIRAISPVSDVEVYVDGELRGRAPQEVRGLRPGQHIVEGRKKGYKTYEETVKLTPGEEMLISLKLEPAPEAKPRGMLRVRSHETDAEVFIDGASLGKAPIDRNDLEPGKHFVIVQKDGFVPFKREVVLVEGTPVVVDATLRSVGALKFLSEPKGATVLIDGEPLAGVTPTLREDVPSGEHVIELKLGGYYDSKQTIKVEGNKERIVSADLQKIPTGPSPEQITRRKKGMSSFGARVLPAKAFTADLGVGWPYLLQARATVGIRDRAPFPFDVGVTGRTFFQYNELLLHARLQLADAGPFYVGVFADAGGGIGPNGRQPLSGDVGGAVSLSFNEVVTITANARFSVWYDQLCPTPGDISRGVKPRKVCTDGTWQMWFDKDPKDNRFPGDRLYSGVMVEASLTRLLSAYIGIEFTPFQYKARKAFLDVYNDVMLEQDYLFYGSTGVTLKF